MDTKQTQAFKNAPDLRLLVLHAGGRLFGVDMAAVAHTGDETCDFAAPQPTPIPGAPPPVRGVVHIRGRLYTVIDPALMFATNEDTATQVTTDRAATSLRVVPLRGKEQLAIAIKRIEEIISICAANIESLTEETHAAKGIVRGNDGQDILVLDTSKLFTAATQGMERRRRRS